MGINTCIGYISLTHSFVTFFRLTMSTDVGIVDDFMYGTNVHGCHKNIRMGFLRKVFGIVAAQLALTTLFSAVAVLSEPVKVFLHSNTYLIMPGFLLTMVTLVALHFKRAETPINFVLLAAFTAFESYTVAVVVSLYEAEVVLQAFLITLVVVTGLVIFTLQSKYDFSAWGAGLFSALLILIMASFMQIFFQSAAMHFAVNVGGALIFSLFIIYDVHMIMHKLSPEEYILAAVNIYLDIINLFLHILDALNSRN